MPASCLAKPLLKNGKSDSSHDLLMTAVPSGLIVDDTLSISGSGKIQTYVAACLEFLQNPFNNPLTLRTLPSKTHHANSLHKLISVVEIIKREFPSHLARIQANYAKAKAEGKAIKLQGPAGDQRKYARLPRTLWQYNKLDCEEAEVRVPDEPTLESNLPIQPAMQSGETTEFSNPAAADQSKGETTASTQSAQVLEDRTLSQPDTSKSGDTSLPIPTADAIKAHRAAMLTLVGAGRKRLRKHHEPNLVVVLSPRRLPKEAEQNGTGWSVQSPARAAPKDGAKRQRKRRKGTAQAHLTEEDVPDVSDLYRPLLDLDAMAE